MLSVSQAVGVVRKREAAGEAVLREAVSALELAVKANRGDPAAIAESVGQFTRYLVRKGVDELVAERAAADVVRKLGSHPSGTLSADEHTTMLNSGRPRGPARRVMSAEHQRSRLNAGPDRPHMFDTRPGAKMPPVADSYPIPGQEDATGPKPRAPKTRPGQDEEDVPSGPRRQDFGDPSEPAVAKITKLAEVLREQNPHLSAAQAFEKVYLANPDLYQRERAERMAAMGITLVDGRAKENVI